MQATVHLTQADTPEQLKQAIEGRIQALANVHALFVKSRWTGAELRSLVMQEILPYSEGGDTRVEVDGPPLFLRDRYGADHCRGAARADHQCRQVWRLSVPEGRVHIAWSHEAGEHLTLRWTETGGPAVQPPTRKGFGTRVMEAMVQSQLKGEIVSIGAAKASSAKSSREWRHPAAAPRAVGTLSRRQPAAAGYCITSANRLRMRALSVSM